MDYAVEILQEYAIGSMEDIKKGTKVTKISSLDEIKTSFQQQSNSSSLILMPTIIGVYRRIGIRPTPNSGAEYLEEKVDFTDKEQFDTHPSLVQIGYDPFLFKRNIISNFIGSESSRMLITPYQELNQGGADLMEYEGIISLRMYFLKRGPTKDEMKQTVDVLKRLIVSEGITKSDYEMMQKHSDITMHID